MEMRVGRIRIIIEGDDVGDDPARLLIELAAALMRLAAEYDGDVENDGRKRDDATDGT